MIFSFARLFFFLVSSSLAGFIQRHPSQKAACPCKRYFSINRVLTYFQVYIVAVKGSFINLTLNYPQVAMAMVLMSVQRRLYNSYLEVENDCLAFLDPPHHDIVDAVVNDVDAGGGK